MIAFIVAAVIGIVVGICSGMLGVGGGMFMIPVFRLALGLSPVESTATSLFTIIPTSASGALTRILNHTCVVKLGLLLGLGGALTSPLGAWLAQVSPGWLVMAMAAIVIAYSALTMLQKARKAPSRPSSTANEEDPERRPEDGTTFAVDGAAALKSLVIGAVTGIASGYVGLGGGFIMVPLMISAFGLSMSLASGTSLVAIMIIAIPGTVTQCLFGNVEYIIAIATACGSIPGAALGARIAPRVPERLLRLAFSCLLAIAAVLLVVKETGLIG